MLETELERAEMKKGEVEETNTVPPAVYLNTLAVRLAYCLCKHAIHLHALLNCIYWF